MRTKALLGLAALAAGALTASAQVYSLNIVGYINVPITAGFNLVVDQLKNGNNGADVALPATTDSQVLKWTGTGFNTWLYNPAFGGWVDETFTVSVPTLPTGEGFFYYNPGAAGSLTFVGEVDGTPGTPVSRDVVSGFSPIGSKLPYDGPVNSTTFNLPIINDMQVLQWTGSGYSTTLYNPAFGGWVDESFTVVPPPSIGLGKAFFYYNPGATPANWTQPF